MSASTLLPLLDMIGPAVDGDGGTASSGGGGHFELAARLIRWSSDEYGHIRSVDETPPHPTDPAERQMFVLMRRAYADWASDAEAVLARVASLKDGAPIEGRTALEDAVGRTRAMLSVSLEDLDQAEEQIRNGQTVTLEEVRRELRAASGR